MDRRSFLLGTTGALTTPALLQAAPLLVNDLRGTIDASKFGLRPGTYDDQSKRFARALRESDRTGRPLFVPPGTYVVSGIELPRRAIVVGLGGTARLVSGGGAILSGRGCETVRLSGLTFDGARQPMAPLDGLVSLSGCADVTIEDCEVTAAGGTGLLMQVCGGVVRDSTFSDARGLCALRSVDATGLNVRDNVVRDCLDGGILIHRSVEGEDGTIVSGNRVERIRAASGGTGQWGNGINVFRAHGVSVTNNVVTDCAFSALRCNAASNVRMSDNTALRSGETAIYSEFGFQGAVVSGNIVDGAAVGISIANFMQGGRLAVVSGNIVRNLSTRGPYPAEVAGFGHGIVVEADTALNANAIEGAPRFGCLLGWGPYLRDVSATGNVVRGVDVGFAVSAVRGAGHATLTGNAISARTAAIRGYEWLEPVTGDLVNGEGLPNLHLASNRATPA